MRETDCPNTGERCIRLKDKNNRISNKQVLFAAGSGHGKSITIEGVAEKLHDHKYLNIFLTDVKGEFEFAFAMFKPNDSFHLHRLEQQNDTPEAKKIKIYHPFTFNLPKGRKHPPMEIFTFPVNWITMEPLQFLLETDLDVASIKIFRTAIRKSKPGDSLHELLYDIEQDVRAKEKEEQNNVKIDYTGFGTVAQSSGSLKEVKDLIGIFEPFIEDFMIQPVNSPTNLNLKELFRDQESYHVLSTKYIKDKKMRAFITFMWIYAILEYRDLCHHPICLILDEIPQLAPFNAKGHQSIMANKLRELAIVRNKGEGGIYSLLGSQLWWDIDDRVNSKATEIFLGKITDLRDQEKLKKVLGSYIGDIVQSLKRGTYVRKGSSRRDTIQYRALFPRHAHAEQEDNFIKRYRKEFPDKMVTFDNIIDNMKKTLKEHQDRVKKLRQKAHDEVMEAKAQKEKAKEQTALEKEKKDQVKVSKAEEKLKELQESEIQRRNDVILNLKDLEGLGYGEISDKIKTSFSPEYHVSRERVGQIYRRLKEGENKTVIVEESEPAPKGPLEEPRDTAD